MGLIKKLKYLLVLLPCFLISAPASAVSLSTQPLSLVQNSVNPYWSGRKTNGSYVENINSQLNNFGIDRFWIRNQVNNKIGWNQFDIFVVTICNTDDEGYITPGLSNGTTLSLIGYEQSARSLSLSGGSCSDYYLRANSTVAWGQGEIELFFSHFVDDPYIPYWTQWRPAVLDVKLSNIDEVIQAIKDSSGSTVDAINQGNQDAQNRFDKEQEQREEDKQASTDASNNSQSSSDDSQQQADDASKNLFQVLTEFVSSISNASPSSCSISGDFGFFNAGNIDLCSGASKVRPITTVVGTIMLVGLIIPAVVTLLHRFVDLYNEVMS